MSTNGNGTYKTAVLSTGREVKVDVEAVRRDVKTRRDIKAIVNLPPGSDDYDRFLSKYSGISEDEIADLSIADFQLVDKLVGAALQELASPNSH